MAELNRVPDTQRARRFLRPQLDYRRAAAAFVLRRLGDSRDMRMAFQKLPQGLAQNSHAAAVHHAQPNGTGQERAIDELLDGLCGLVDCLADDVDLGRNAVVLARQRNVDTL